ncbi:uncharacterized protein DFL_003224 [Arthrobotrys flagrans]|uniref:Uncharacterized protein n=1 Tax=Arthrobotrys flagrans TaxID=97331 RepID=A0A437A0U8_ARTFL|nr:hypothetical protein DFL_003224 [Arthrobotrys flagrans]
MENQPLTPPRRDEDESPIFHKSKFVRALLGIGLIFQACIGVSCLTMIALQSNGYNSGSSFSIEVFHLLALVYAIGFLWNSTIWFFCIYYNKSLPRDNLFILLELARSIPCLLASVLFMIFATPDILREFRNALNGGYYGIYLFEFIVSCVICVVCFGPALWSLVWMFIYFIRERKEEIVKLLKIGGKKSEEGTEAGRDGGEGGETATIGNEQDAEETPLLIDHDQMA